MKRYSSPLVVMVLLLSFVSAFAQPSAMRNTLYVSNREPLLPEPLAELPVGSIRPEGWLRQQLSLMADGFSGHLSEISKWCKIEGSAWSNPKGQGENGWEELPYWLKGYVDLGYVLRDDRIIAEANTWIEGVLSAQDSSGYFGPRKNLEQPDIWPNMVMLYVLRTHYEATGDGRVLPFMLKYFRWLTTVPLERFLLDSWQKWRGGDNLDHIYWLYNQTGAKRLLDLARTNHERTADWSGGIPSWHGVNLCQGFREPAEFYQQVGDIRYLRATERNYDSIMTTYGQVPGGMFGADENARSGYSGPRQGAETCSMVEMMHSDEILLAITGEAVWADRAEEIAFNSLPAAMTPDLKGLHYLTAPNMVQLDRVDKAPMIENGGDMLSYRGDYYRCCQHNVAFGWPYYAEHLWMATQDDGLAAVLYGACTVAAKVGDGTAVQIAEKTDYPFGETVEFRLSVPNAVMFPLVLRVPGWCSAPSVQINGKPAQGMTRSAQWIQLRRIWSDGDVVRLEVPMQVTMKTWRKNNNAVSVYRGPLAYSLKIGERWSRYGGSDSWPYYEVYPTTPWNYGLIVDPGKPAASFKVVLRKGTSARQPFAPDDAPIALEAKARRVPQWKLESNGLIGVLQQSPVRSDQPVETVTLIPMGCARLRLSAFPWIGEGADANVWK